VSGDGWLQLGIGGALLFVVWQLAAMALRNWREVEAQRLDVYAKAEEQRTNTIAAGFATLTGKVDTHTTADLASHQALATGIAEIKGALGAAPVQQQPARDTGPVRLLRASTENDR
jgi:hypothetical protein